MKKLIRLTEGDLHRIIEGAVKRTLNEIGDTPRGQYMLGRLAARQHEDDQKSGNYDKSNNTYYYADKQMDQHNLSRYPYFDGYYGHDLGFHDFEDTYEEVWKKAFDYLNTPSIKKKFLSDNIDLYHDIDEDVLYSAADKYAFAHTCPTDKEDVKFFKDHWKYHNDIAYDINHLKINMDVFGNNEKKFINNQIQKFIPLANSARWE